MDRALTARTVLVLALLAACARCGGGGGDRGSAAEPPSDDGMAPIETGADAAEDSPAGDALAEDAAARDVSADAPAMDAESTVEQADSGPHCPIVRTPSTAARAAHSAGYSGSDSAYYALYGAPCQVPGDCESACTAGGGTSASCSTGTQCLPGAAGDGGSGCVPPPVWLTVDGALSQSGTTANAAQLVMVAVPYEDPLVLTDFGLAIPDGSMITGIQFQVRKATLSGNAADDVVQVVRAGNAVGMNHATTGAAWPTALTAATYGGAYDTWGSDWSATDVTSTGFGISIAAKYTGPVNGNEHAYVDSVQVTVFYAPPCD